MGSWLAWRRGSPWRWNRSVAAVRDGRLARVGAPRMLKHRIFYGRRRARYKPSDRIRMASFSPLSRRMLGGSGRSAAVVLQRIGPMQTSTSGRHGYRPNTVSRIGRPGRTAPPSMSRLSGRDLRISVSRTLGSWTFPWSCCWDGTTKPLRRASPRGGWPVCELRGSKSSG
jgi:hypothetical protein